MKKHLEAFADFLRERPLILTACALICAVLGAVLLWNQVTLNRQVEARLSPSPETEPSIHWYEEETTTAAPVPTDSPVQSIETQPVSGEYVLNTNSKKIHKADCRYAVSLKAENRAEADAEQLPQLLRDGYTYCSVCCP